MPAAPVQPEAPDNMLEALQGASINEEHHAIMSVVVQKVQSAKSVVERFTGLVRCEFASDGFLPPPYGRRRSVVPTGSKPGGGGPGGAARQPPGLQE